MNSSCFMIFMVRTGFETMMYGLSKTCGWPFTGSTIQVVKCNSKHVQCLWKGLFVWMQLPEKRRWGYEPL